MKTVYIIGLGPGDYQALTIRSWRLLKKSRHVFVRTDRHPGLNVLNNYGISYQSFDRYYEKAQTFEQTYYKIAKSVVDSAQKYGEVVYAVPGSPFFAEKSVELILKKAKEKGVLCRVIPAISFVDAICAELKLTNVKDLKVVDAMEEDKPLSHPDKHLLIMQAYNSHVASRVKLDLASHYPANHQITVLRGAGLSRGKKIVRVPLFKIDRLPFIDHLTTFYVPPAVKYGISDLLGVMRRLRSENGCPWDIEQDHLSLRPYLLEEAYEVIGAIDSGNKKDLCEELGDLLLQVIFHGQIATENEDFTFFDIVTTITEKLIRRHPHVFSTAVAKTSDDVLKTWQQIKKEEKSERKSLFKLENYLPALLRAQKLQRQASSVGFDWPDVNGAWEKVTEELKELKDVYKQQQEARIEEELGDVLFSIVNVARFLNVDAEQALAKSINKFYTRLTFVEQKAQAQGGGIADHSLSKLDEWWNEAKNSEDGL